MYNNIFYVPIFFWNINMKEYFYFTKGQRRGVLLLITIIIIAILTKWVI